MPELTFRQLLPHLEALAYLLEVVIAQAMFLAGFRRREPRSPLRNLPLVFMFVLAGATGIPAGSSLIRFLWYFLLMVWQVAGALSWFQGSLRAILPACMAGFAAQHIANKLTILFRLIPPVGAALRQAPTLGIPLEILVFAGTYALIHVLFAKNIRHYGDNIHLSLLSGAIIFLCIGVNRLVVDTAEESALYEAAVCIYAIIGCVFALIIQVYISRWEEERSQALIMRRLLADSEKQYEQWKSSVEHLRIAVHDIKHMLAQAQALADQKQVELPDLKAIGQMVDRYSPSIRTGNDVLDILLRNMTALCSQDQIALNCAAYTDHLKYFDGMSLYFLFVNAIDNAMKSVALVDDPGKRIIDISIRRFGGSLVIHIWNYFTGKVRFADGLPVPHEDSQIHGFGMKSIRLIVERLDGVLDVRTEGQVFNLDVMLPLPPG